MILVLIFILIIAFVGVGLWLELQGNMSDKTPLPGLLEREKVEKFAAKRRVLNYMSGEGQVTNDLVQDILKVSDATATRYLEELEEEGLIRQVGARGRGVYYVKM